MTNVGLLPGTSSLEEIIADTADGIYMENNRSWSIDDRRLQLPVRLRDRATRSRTASAGGCCATRPTPGIGPAFWASLDALAGPDELVVWGTPNCGKGQPLQIGHTGHPAVPGRFREVRVGVRG